MESEFVRPLLLFQKNNSSPRGMWVFTARTTAGRECRERTRSHAAKDGVGKTAAAEQCGKKDCCHADAPRYPNIRRGASVGSWASLLF
jgi:hypothetical protein